MAYTHSFDMKFGEWGEWSECEDGVRAREDGWGGLEEEGCEVGGDRGWSDWGECSRGFQVSIVTQSVTSALH